METPADQRVGAHLDAGPRMEIHIRINRPQRPMHVGKGLRITPEAPVGFEGQPSAAEALDQRQPATLFDSRLFPHRREDGHLESRVGRQFVREEEELHLGPAERLLALRPVEAVSQRGNETELERCRHRAPDWLKGPRLPRRLMEPPHWPNRSTSSGLWYLIGDVT